MDNSQIIALIAGQQGSLDFTMHVGELKFPVDSFGISHSQTPVTKPTLRGGVYFSDVKEFRIKARLSGKSLPSILSRTMLGPNTDFEKIKFLTSIDVYGTKKQVAIFANLTNYAQKADGFELNLTVVGTDLAD